MIKNFNDFILEARGINKNLEMHVDNIYEYLLKHPEKKSLQTCFTDDKGKMHPVEIIIGENLDTEANGIFSDIIYNDGTNKMKIYLKKLDKSVLMHEFMHLFNKVVGLKNDKISYSEILKPDRIDFTIKNPNFASINQIKDKDVQKIVVLIYKYEKEELTANYNGAYQGIKSYIEKYKTNPKFITIINGNDNSKKKELITHIISLFFEREGMVYQDYLFIDKKVLHNAFYKKNKKVDYLFYRILKDKVKYEDLSIPSLLRELVVKKTAKIFSKSERDEINKLKSQYIKILEPRVEKYKRKFYGLYSLFVDKYTDKK